MTTGVHTVNSDENKGYCPIKGSDCLRVDTSVLSQYKRKLFLSKWEKVTSKWGFLVLR